MTDLNVVMHTTNPTPRTASRAKWLIQALLASLLVLTLSGCAMFGGAKEEPPPAAGLESIRATGVLRVGMTGKQPPFNVRTRSGAIIGLDADLANALADTIGVRAEFVELDFNQLISALEEGQVDMVISELTMTPGRNSRVAFAGPYFISGKAILTKSATLARANEAEDINRPGITLTALSGSTSEDFVRELVPSARLIATTDHQQAAQLVIDDEADAMVADLPTCVVTELRNPDAGLSTLASPLSYEPLGIALPADDPLLLNLVQNYMYLLEGTGLMDQLRAKWFSDPSWLSELP
jgi:polar amino acid transport system substrate-binding protein